MRTSEKRLVVVAVDAAQLQQCADSMKCTVSHFVALALADAMAAELEPGGACEVALEVDGHGWRVRVAGGLGAD